MRFSLWAATCLVFLTFTVSIVPVNAANSLDKLDSLRRFSQILDLVERYYVDDVAREKIIEGAIRGMLQNLDPHSAFLDEEEMKEMQETTEGEFFGIGVEISQDKERVIVVSPIDDTPADKAGMRAGDTIVAVDNEIISGMDLRDVVKRIRGPKGSRVTLTILHENANTTDEITVERAAIPIISVKAKELEEGILWVRLSRFSERTLPELEEALEKQQKQGKIEGIVLDLRNNPGGLLDQSVYVADKFLHKGTIVSIKGRTKDDERVFEATDEKSDIDAPLVVLINAGSASASEIVAGALRDHNRALLLGEDSFGKGSVQNIIPLSDGSAVKMTIALYYTPNDISIQAEGIKPDIFLPFELPSEKDTKVTGLRFREKDLSGHLEKGKKGKNTEKVTKEKAKASEEIKKALERDNQLRMALQLVKKLPRLHNIQ